MILPNIRLFSSLQPPRPDDLSIVCFTSGTTGKLRRRCSVPGCLAGDFRYLLCPLWGRLSLVLFSRCCWLSFAPTIGHARQGKGWQMHTDDEGAQHLLDLGQWSLSNQVTSWRMASAHGVITLWEIAFPSAFCPCLTFVSEVKERL